MVLSWCKRFVGTHSQRELAEAEGVLRAVERHGRTIAEQTDAQLQRRAEILRERARGGATLEALVVETFALVREVAARQVGLRPFDVQILAGAALQRGNVVEMKTGEGKTLVGTLPVVLYALAGRGAHVITVNDYLAARDAAWMAPVYRFMGLTVGVVTEELAQGGEGSPRWAAYQADVTYVTNHDLVFDYLRDNLARAPHEQVQRPLHFALVDEVDLLLLDEAGTPLIISGPAEQHSDLPVAARQVVASLTAGEDFRVDHRLRRVAIQDVGWSTLERRLGIENLAAPEHLFWQHALHNALLAHAVYQRDVDYIVQDGAILLVDDHTGRVSPDKRFSDGLHQALEAKEGVTVRAEDRTLAKVSYQMFFRLYPSLCGMTGTAYSAREELRRTYGLRVVVVPTNRPVRRDDEPAVVYLSKEEKFAAVVAELQRLVAQERPVLIGTTSVWESEEVSGYLQAAGIAHTVLNAKDDRAEAAIIAEAGRPAAVTVSTNMSGRGVDIHLGGQGADNGKGGDRDRVVAAGGLMVIGTGLHESRRIDDQLRGRAGRQGDPGGSRYLLSLDDAIYRKFGERDRGHQVLEALRWRLRDHPHGEPVFDRQVLRTLRQLQKKVEVENEAIRRDVLRYDVVVDQQRRTIYGWRQTLLGQEPAQTIALLYEMAGEDDPAEALAPDPAAEAGDGDGAAPSLRAAQIRERLASLEAALGRETLAAIAGQVMLVTIDALWTEHLGNLEQIDDAVGLRGYAQLDPLLEYRREAHQLYLGLLDDLREQVLAAVLAMAARLRGPGPVAGPDRPQH